MSKCIALIGGGLAAQRCAEALRRAGCEKRVVLVGEESRRPYSRPPLSKEVLLDSRAEDSAYLRPAAWYEERDIELRLGVRATGLDAHELRVTLSDGGELRAERVLIATGARPRMLPELAGRSNVSTLHTMEDARAIGGAIRDGGPLAIVGAGFIGQEVAATARSRGVEVTMIDLASAPMAHVLGEQLGSWFAELHRSRGVILRLGRTVKAAIGEPAVHTLLLDDGSAVRCRHVVLGIGVQPAVDWLQGTGLPGGGHAPGPIPTDDRGATTIPGVYAAGDVAAPFEALLQRHLPCAHWEAAGRMGARAGRAMLGLDPGAAAASSFWSDQYDTRFHYIGHAALADALEIEGDLEAPDFTAMFRRAGQPVAALLAGRPQQLPQIRRLLANEQGS